MTSRIRQVQSLRAVPTWACLRGQNAVLHTELPGATPGLSTAARAASYLRREITGNEFASQIPVHGSTWLEHSVRVGGIGGSNPPGQTQDRAQATSSVANPSNELSKRRTRLFREETTMRRDRDPGRRM